MTIRFQTPTELKSAGGLAERPEFPILFGRLRDRISTLRSLYGAGALDIDFKGLGERAARVELRHCDLAWEQVKRKSGRTGQVHPIGGFTGEAEYAGPLGEFLPWLRAARWVGVGRQTADRGFGRMKGRDLQGRSRRYGVPCGFEPVCDNATSCPSGQLPSYRQSSRGALAKLDALPPAGRYGSIKSLGTVAGFI